MVQCHNLTANTFLPTLPAAEGTGVGLGREGTYNRIAGKALQTLWAHFGL